MKYKQLKYKRFNSGKVKQYRKIGKYSKNKNKSTISRFKKSIYKR